MSMTQYMMKTSEHKGKWGKRKYMKKNMKGRQKVKEGSTSRLQGIQQEYLKPTYSSEGDKELLQLM